MRLHQAAVDRDVFVNHARDPESNDRALPHPAAIEIEHAGQIVRHRLEILEHNASDALVHDFAHGAAVERRDRRAAGHRLGEDQAERLARLNRVEQGAGAAVQLDLRRKIRLAVIDDAAAIHVGRHVIAVVRVLGGGEDEAHADTLGDLDRLQHALAFGETAKKEQVVVGLFLEHEVVGVDAVQHGLDHVQSGEQARLLVRDGDEGGLRVARPQRHLRRARRVMQRLHDGGRRQPREGERHGVVRRFVMNDVEVARPLDRGRKIQHLVELPRPHVLVMPVAVREDRVEPGLGGRVFVGEERDVVAALDEPLGQERRHDLDRAGFSRRDRRRHGGNVRNAQRRCVGSVALRCLGAQVRRCGARVRRRGRGAHTPAASSSFGMTTRASKCSRAISPARRACHA